MGGGLMQLVAYGAQDIYLTGNPQITFFKVVYRRHTNFSMETISQTFNGSPGSGATVTATISRNGDLVHKLYLNSTTDLIVNGSAIISEVELEIGGQRIDRHYQEWMNVWTELSTDDSKAIGLKSMQGDIGSSGTGLTGVAGVVQIPLQFWFCRNPGLALPLIALQYHEVKVKVQLATGVVGAAGVDLVADYIYLDTDERRRFAQVSHEYLIEQLQRETFTGATDTEYKLNFNHPVKELIWTSDTAYTSAQIKLNGHDRFAEQKEEYFTLRQPFDYHTAVPKQNLPSAARVSLLDRQIEMSLPTGQNATVLDIEPNLAGVGAANEIALVGGVLHIQGNASLTAFATEFGVGSQLAIVLVAVDGDVVGTGSPAIGDIFFTTVTSVVTGSAATVVTVNISTPTSTSSVAKTLTTLAGANGASKCQVFVVSNGNSAQARTSQMTEKINVYSFALKPEEHQPSGTCNFSRIDNAQLKITGTPHSGTFSVYAVNYNVLRIMSGMGGLAYSN